MKNCPNCNAQIEENARFCLYCMTTFEKKSTIITSRCKHRSWQLYSLACISVIALMIFGVLLIFKGGTDSQNPTTIYAETSEGISSASVLSSKSDYSSSITASSENGTSNTTTNAKTSITSHQPTTPNQQALWNNGDVFLYSSTPSIWSNSTIQQSFVSSYIPSTSSAYPSYSSISSQTNSSFPASSSSQTSSSSQVSSTSQVIADSFMTEEEFWKYAQYEIEDGEATITKFSYYGTGRSIEIPSSVNGTPITIIGYKAFYSSDNIRSLVIPNSIKKISSYAFYDASITSLSLAEGLQKLGDFAFFDCDNLTSITIPKSVTSFGDSVFGQCTNLAHVNLPENLTVFPFIISGSEALESINLPESIIQLEGCCLANCTKLKTVKLPKKITEIPGHAFQNDVKLKSIYIGKNVTRINSNAFENCDSLMDVYFEGSENQRNNIRIFTGNECLLDATWHYNCDF